MYAIISKYCYKLFLILLEKVNKKSKVNIRKVIFITKIRRHI